MGIGSVFLKTERPITTGTRGAAPDPIHLSCRPSKVEPKKGAPTEILNGKSGRPRYRDKTCSARKTAIFNIQGFEQSSRLRKPGDQQCRGDRLIARGERKEMFIKKLKSVEFFYGKVCLTNELAQQAGAEFIMLGDG